jgi:flagellin-like hook-associated protein FlgL
MIINNSLFPVKSGFNAVSDMRSRIDQLQQQLATGKRAQTLGQLGKDRVIDLSIRSRLSGMQAYQQNIKTVGLRLDMMNTVFTRLDGLESEARSSLTLGSVDFTSGAVTQAQYQNETRLKEVIELMNTDLNGRHLFGGNVTDKNPVASFDVIMDGTGGKAGFRQVLGERRDADLGTSGQGRITTNFTGTTLELAEDGVHPFGFKLDSLTAEGSGVSLTGPTGSPSTLSVEFTGQPGPGDRINIGLALPDGTKTTISLKATLGPTAQPGEFLIGANAGDTATNFNAAFNTALDEKATGELPAASAYAAAEMFFTKPGETAMRVDGPPYDSATGLVAATSSDTISWYQGEDSTVPRRSALAKVDDNTEVAYGVQANEEGTAELVRNLAVLSAESFNGGNPNDGLRFKAMSVRAFENLSESNNSKAGSIESVSMDIGLAQTSLGRAKERLDHQEVALETMLSDIEDIPPEEVAMQLLSLQTRLEASYATIGKVSQLSLVNFLP